MSSIMEYGQLSRKQLMWVDRCPVVCLCVQGHQGMSQVTHLDGQVAVSLGVVLGSARAGL